MWEWISLFWAGTVRIWIPISLRTAVVDWLFRTEIQPYRERLGCKSESADSAEHCRIVRRAIPGSGKDRRDISASQDAYSFVLRQCDFARFVASAETYGWEYGNDRLRGLPTFLGFLRKRPGIAAGFVVLFLWCFLSQNLIWKVEIEGNTTTDEGEITTLLEELGCGVGDWIPGIDYDWVHANFRARSESIAWLSVYQRGTVAKVQVREAIKPPQKDGRDCPGVYANVVAAAGGEIVLTEVFSGEAAVQIGDVVLPGEVLISGVCQMRHENQYRLTYARGRVLAKVAYPITVEITRERKVKRYTGKSKTDVSLKIFKKEINLFKTTGNPYATCDTISTMEEVCLWNRYAIPVWITRTVYREYDTVTETVNTQKAADEAMAELRRQIAIAVENGELISQTVKITSSEDKYRLECLLYCEKDIAKTAEFRDVPITNTMEP